MAAKALRVCLSDLAAGGSTPFVYQLSLALPSNWTGGLGRGLRQRVGRGPAALRHRPVRRRHGRDAGAAHRHDHRLRPGGAAQGARARRGAGRGRTLGERHDRRRGAGPAGGARRSAQRCRPASGHLSRIAIACRDRAPRWDRDLIGIATRGADVSDGLLADAGHVAAASRLAVHIEREEVPLSVRPGGRWPLDAGIVGERAGRRRRLRTGDRRAAPEARGLAGGGASGRCHR